ncbi:sugar phosphate isomerase/epimerase family protein [Neptunomonas phycophila]|uniref:sugar phosphate isomerase/epimerase family protein n=1 Tax=Neptunomonas phycophila TaxID=1572645 RepID=UPI0009490896|nr:TIM barrel protein [Neptunomonas phycophila]
MKLEIFRTLWGVQTPIECLAGGLKAKGFCGVESRFSEEKHERLHFRRVLEDEGLSFIGIIFTGSDVIPDQSETSAQHLERLARKLRDAHDLAPRFINVLPGNDRWSLTEQVDFFGKAQALAKDHNMLCSFETHRASSLYSPWVTMDLIRQLPDLQFTTDISHWVLVCERLLNSEQDDLSPFLERVHHIQARVGYDQGPQVPHPAAPEYAESLAFHQGIWESVWRQHLKKGYEQTTLTTEFGADGYLHHLPFTNVPVADLASLNDWMALTERQHFQEFLAHMYATQ